MAGGLERKLLKEQLRGLRFENDQKAMNLGSPTSMLNDMRSIMDLSHQQAMNPMIQESTQLGLENLPEEMALKLKGMDLDNSQTEASTRALDAQRLIQLMGQASSTHDTSPMIEQVQNMIDPHGTFQMPQLERLPNPLLAGQEDPEEAAQKEQALTQLRDKMSQQSRRDLLAKRFNLNLN